MHRPIIIERNPISFGNWNDVIRIKILEPHGHTMIEAYIVRYQIRDIHTGDMILVGYFLGVGDYTSVNKKSNDQLNKMDGLYRRIIIHQDATKIKNILIDEDYDRKPLGEMEGHLTKGYTHKPLRTLHSTRYR